MTILQDLRFGYFQSKQHREELELVSDKHGVTNDGHLGLYCILYGHGRDVLPTSSDDQFCEDRFTKYLCDIQGLISTWKWVLFAINIHIVHTGHYLA